MAAGLLISWDGKIELSFWKAAVSSWRMNKKPSQWLPILLMVIVVAITRMPGLLPPNFSAVCALAFCAGIYFPGRMAWWVPMATFLGTDMALNLYYKYVHNIDTFNPATLVFLAANYAVYPVLIWMGRKFTPKASFVTLLGGGILGAILFFLVTNTVSWFFNPFGNPEYTKDLAGWIRALSVGTSGYPPTWEFFINSLTSGGLFTGLFAGAMKLSEAVDAAKEEAEAEDEAEDPASPEEAPEEAEA